MRTLVFVGFAAVALATTPAIAQKADHSGHDKHMGDMASEAATEAKAVAVIHSIDAEKGMLNVTHDPVPEIKWPQMTMDLPVTKRVDLSKIKAGDKVTLTLKQGMDKQYRITEIAPAK